MHPDPAAIVEALYAAHATALFAYCVRRVSCPELAADICQEAFTKMLATLRSGVEVRYASGYLHRIAKNLIVDSYRERDKAKVISLEDAALLVAGRMEYGDYAGYAVEIDERLLRDGDDLETDTIDRLDFAATYQRAERGLTPNQATAIRLRYLGGYAFEEIGDALDITKGAAQQLKVRGMVTLRAHYAGD